MTTPIPGLTVQVSANQELQFFDFEKKQIKKVSAFSEITNYNYEISENEKKRKILLLKKEFLPAFIENFRKSMRYDKSSQYINNKNKKGSNPNINKT